MARVRDVMTLAAAIPKVGAGATVLESAKAMNDWRRSAVAVVDPNGKVIGFFSERTLLTEFVALDKRPDEVKVGEIMHMLYRIQPDATAKEAAKKLSDYGTTRLGVFDGDDFLGWVTLTDLSRYFSKENLLDRLRSHNAPEESEVRCPNCRKAMMLAVTDSEGRILRWQCPNCGYAL